jgi:hypothetical protein
MSNPVSNPDGSPHNHDSDPDSDPGSDPGSEDATEQQPGVPQREEQHGPEMDDDQVQATNEFTDSLPPAGGDTEQLGD